MSHNFHKPLSGNPYIDGLLWDGWIWDTSPLVYGFPDTAAQYPTASAGFDTLNTLQRDAARLAFHEIASFTNYSFFDGGTDGVIRLAGATTVDTNNNPDDGLEQTISTASGRAPSDEHEAAGMEGDIWFNPTGYDNPLVGSFQFAAGIIHEIGHALGLKHPHQTQDSAQLLPADRDGLAYSIMSYRDFPGDGIAANNSGNNCPQSYMLYDIQALQYLYGANFTLNATDTVYKFTPTIEAGKGTNFFVNGSEYEPNVDLAANIVFRTIWDAGGVDTYDFSSYTTDLSVNLDPGQWTNLGTQLAVLSGDDGTSQNAPGNIANAFLYQGDTRSLIENAIGGSGDDALLGNQIGNQLTGNAGDDTLKGYGGQDTLIGGADDDTYFLFDTTSSGYDAVVEDAGGGTDEIVITGGDATSYALGSNIENGAVSIVTAFDLTGNELSNELTGNDAVNALLGAAGQDTLLGRAGDDSLTGGLADDYLDGGNDGDTAYFAGNKTDFVIIGAATDLTIADRTPGRFGTDRVLNVETFVFLDGTFTAAELANAAPIITSNGGNDLAVPVAENTYFVTKVAVTDSDGDPLTFTLSGADAALFQIAVNGDITFRTTPDFEVPNSSDGDNVYDFLVTVSDPSFATDTQAIAVTVTDVVEIFDTDPTTDVLNGTAGADIITPGDGTDTVFAGDGNDVIKATVNDGNDVYDGGSGSDTLDLSALTSGVSVSLGPKDGSVTGFGTRSAEDKLISIENVIGTASADKISGNSLANVLEGGGGNDLLTGGGGNDKIVFRPGFGLDKITDFDDAGNDTMVFSTAVFADWAAVQNAMSVSGADVVITLDAANTITLVGTTLASMTQSDFLFVP